MFLAEPTISGFFFLAPWLVFAPVLGLLINLIFGKRFSETMVGTVAKSCLRRGLRCFRVVGLVSCSKQWGSGSLATGGMDPHRHITTGLDLPGQLVIRNDDAGGFGSGNAHPHLCHRLYA